MTQQRAAQYLRMSTDRQQYSLVAQAAYLASYAADHELEIVQSYEDAGRSGLTAEKRDGLARLLADVLSGGPGFSVLLVLDVSRWGRYQDPDEAAHYEFICRSAGIDVRYCAEAFDNDCSVTSVLIKSMKRAMAAEYSRQLSSRTSAGRLRSSERGNARGGSAPFGFRRRVFNADSSPGPILGEGERSQRFDQVTRYVLGPDEEVQTLQACFRLYLKRGIGLTYLAQEMNEQGLTYSRGRPWNDSRLRSVLRNEMAIGVMTFATYQPKFGKSGTLLPRDHWRRVTILPPLVPKATFAEVQRRLASMDGRSMTDEEMIRRLKALLRRRGRLSWDLINQAEGLPHATSYYKRFGSLAAASALAGYEPRRRFRSPNANREDRQREMLEELRALYEEQGFLSVKTIQADPRLRAVNSYVCQFGSLTEAYRRVGFDLTNGERISAGWRRGHAE